MASSQIPCAIEQGIFFAGTGRFSGRTENLIEGSENSIATIPAAQSSQTSQTSSSQTSSSRAHHALFRSRRLAPPDLITRPDQARIPGHVTRMWFSVGTAPCSLGRLLRCACRPIRLIFRRPIWNCMQVRRGPTVVIRIKNSQ